MGRDKGTRFVLPREKTTSGGLNSNFLIPVKRPSRRWSQAVGSIAQQTDERKHISGDANSRIYSSLGNMKGINHISSVLLLNG